MNSFASCLKDTTPSSESVAPRYLGASASASRSPGALVGNPRILVFDEATSALDYESELAIQQNMAEICKGRTVFIIAHRLSAVRACDRIITVEAGEVVEDGTHATLIKAGGRYAKLWAAQTTTTRTEPPDTSPPAAGKKARTLR